MSGQDSDDGQFYTEAVGTRLSPQTKEKFDRYKEENELSNSEALRRLIRSQLEPDHHNSLLGASLLAGVLWALAVLLGNQSWSTIIGGVHVLYALVWAVHPRGWLR